MRSKPLFLGFTLGLVILLVWNVVEAPPFFSVSQTDELATENERKDMYENPESKAAASEKPDSDSGQNTPPEPPQVKTFNPEDILRQLSENQVHICEMESLLDAFTCVSFAQTVTGLYKDRVIPHSLEALLSDEAFFFAFIREISFAVPIAVRDLNKGKPTVGRDVEQILYDKWGQCGDQVIVAKAALQLVGLESREVEFYLNDDHPYGLGSHIALEVRGSDGNFMAVDVTHGITFFSMTTPKILAFDSLLMDPVIGETLQWPDRPSDFDRIYYLRESQKITGDVGTLDIDLRAKKTETFLHKKNWLGVNSENAQPGMRMVLLLPEGAKTIEVDIAGSATDSPDSMRICLDADCRQVSANNNHVFELTSNSAVLTVSDFNEYGYVVLDQIKIRSGTEHD